MEEAIGWKVMSAIFRFHTAMLGEKR